MRLFEVRAGAGPIIRMRHETLDGLRAALPVGYIVTGEVLGASMDGIGGVVDPVLPGAISIMGSLLVARGDVLLDWLSTHPQLADGIAARIA